MSWILISRSFRVLRQDVKLALFPVLSGLAGLAIAALFLLSPLGAGLFNKSAQTFGAAEYVSLLLVYCAFYFVMIFFNCALAACVQARFSGSEIGVVEGINRAASRIQPILFWSLLSSTIGILLQVAGRRMGIIAKIATR